MSVRFIPLRTDLSSLQAKAASGRSGVARRAQEELKRLVTLQLEREVRG
jgi:hypothetical protein